MNATPTDNNPNPITNSQPVDDPKIEAIQNIIPESDQSQNRQPDPKEAQIQESASAPVNPPETTGKKLSDDKTGAKDLKLSGKRMTPNSGMESSSKEKSKIPGRWSPEEHDKFVKGNLMNIHSDCTFWKKLEKS